MQLELDPDNGRLRGHLTAHAGAEGAARFRLGEPFMVEAVRQGGRTLEFEPMGGGEYRLLQRAGPGAPLEIEWSGALRESPGASANMPFLGAEGGFLPPGSAWWPQLDGALPFALDLTARLPADQRFVASGSLGGESLGDGFYTARYTHPRAVTMAVATGPWQLRESVRGAVRLRTFFPPALHASHAELYLQRAAGYLEMFQRRAGPYPFDSFTMAATPLPVGIAYPGFTLLGHAVIPLPFIPETSLAHELLHGWWGNGVYAGESNWLEGLTTYMADYYLDEQRGAGEDTRRRWLLDLAALPAHEERPLAEFRGGNQGVERSIGYHRAAMLFHMLSLRVGAQAFDEGARLLRDRHLFTVADWPELAAAFGDAAGEDLGDYFAAWVERTGAPRLEFEDVRREERDGVEHVVGRLRQIQEDPPWPVTVPIVVTTTAGEHRENLRMLEREVAFDLSVPARARRIEADPEYDVLRERPGAPPILRGVALDSRTRVVAPDPTHAPLAAGVLGQNPELVNELADEPLLVIGTTQAVSRWLDEQGVEETPHALRSQGAARAWALPGRRMTVLSADDETRLAALVQAVQRQGYLSYLVQDAAGALVDSGIWESDADALVITF